MCVYVYIYIYIYSFLPSFTRGCPRCVMVKMLACGIIVSVFELRYYVHFWTNTLGKGMNPLILPAMG